LISENCLTLEAYSREHVILLVRNKKDDNGPSLSFKVHLNLTKFSRDFEIVKVTVLCYKGTDCTGKNATYCKAKLFSRKDLPFEKNIQQ